MFIYFHSINKCRRYVRSFTTKPKWRLMFFGSDDFALVSLRKMCKEYKSNSFINCLEVVTNTHLKSKSNVIEKFAIGENLKTHSWPIETPKMSTFDLGVVVSFGHLIPNRIINAFPLGMINIHGSLLPRWRGAAPVIHALINGDTETGVTVMRIRPQHFDIGEIIDQSRVPISENMRRIELHKKLAELGADMLIKCIRELPKNLDKAVTQNDQEATYAPKITPTVAQLNWSEMTSKQIYNLHRAVSDIHPLVTMFQDCEINVHDAFLIDLQVPREEKTTGFVEFVKDYKAIRVWCKDAVPVYFKSVRIKAKRKMTASDFYNGYLNQISKDLHYFGDIR